MRALIAGARGEPVDARTGDPRGRGDPASRTRSTPAFKAEAILLPSESLIADRMDVVDPDAIHASREQLRAAIGSALRSRAPRARIAATAPRATISAPRPKASGGFAPSRSALIAAADRARGGARSPRRSSTGPTI